MGNVKQVMKWLDRGAIRTERMPGFVVIVTTNTKTFLCAEEAVAVAENRCLAKSIPTPTAAPVRNDMKRHGRGLQRAREMVRERIHKADRSP